MPGDRRLQILAVAHVALGVLTAVLAPVELRTRYEFKHILIVPFFASAFCQSFLLCLWVAASQAMLWKRLAGLVIGVLYLESLETGLFIRVFPDIWIITITVTMGSLLVLRRFGVMVERGRSRSFRTTRAQETEVERQADRGQPARSEPRGPRFSIRGMMIFTAAVAVLCTGATHVWFLMKLVVAMCFVVVGLFSLWAALEDARRLQWGLAVAVFVLSSGLGAFWAFPARAPGQVYILLIMVLYPTALMGSLLVVRSCGYRLVRGASAEWIHLHCSAPARQRGTSEDIGDDEGRSGPPLEFLDPAAGRAATALEHGDG